MRTTTTIAVLAALALLVAPSASAESDFETAKKEFTCEPPEEREAVKDDMFDEQELPDSVTASFGRADASSSSSRFCRTTTPTPATTAG